jgi:hypothetical protein
VGQSLFFPLQRYPLLSLQPGQALFQRPLPTYLIMTLRLATILSSHLNCRRIGLLNRRVMTPTPRMVMSTSIPDKNRTAGKEKQG